MRQEESLIKKAILDYLSFVPGCFAWSNSTRGTYDPRQGCFLKRNSKYEPNGIADILGIYKGRFLAIEVKTEKGVLSDVQAAFLEKVQKQGGLVLVARSVKDVRTFLFPDKVL